MIISADGQQTTDPRYYQIAFQSAFLIYGTWVLGWDQEIGRIALLMVLCLATQAFFILLGKQKPDSLKSAFITSLGLSLLLRSTEIWVLALAAVAAIAGKFLIRFNNKHVFNPANLGMAVAILFTGKAWVSPGQWGSDLMYPISIVLAGLIVCYKVKRAQTGLVFLGVLFLLEFTKRYIYLGWPADLVFHRFSSGSLLIYALFMITDPMTTPNHSGARVLWAAILAVLTFGLSNWFQIYEAPVWALLILSPFTPLFDRLRQAPRFQWNFQTNTKAKYI